MIRTIRITVLSIRLKRARKAMHKSRGLRNCAKFARLSNRLYSAKYPTAIQPAW